MLPHRLAFPILVLISESICPALRRGDVISISNRSGFISVGDVPVVWFQGKEFPTVHGAIEVHFEVAQPEEEGTLGIERFEGMIEAVKRAHRVAAMISKADDTDERG